MLNDKIMMLEKGFISGTHVFGRQQTRCDFMSLLIYLRLMDNLHVRLIFGLGKNSRKELINISKTAKFGYTKCCKIRKI